MCSKADQLTTKSNESSGAGRPSVEHSANSSDGGRASATPGGRRARDEQVLAHRVQVEANEAPRPRSLHEAEIGDPISAADVRDVAVGQRQPVLGEERDHLACGPLVVVPEPLGPHRDRAAVPSPFVSGAS